MQQFNAQNQNMTLKLKPLKKHDLSIPTAQGQQQEYQKSKFLLDIDNGITISIDDDIDGEGLVSTVRGERVKII